MAEQRDSAPTTADLPRDAGRDEWAAEAGCRSKDQQGAAADSEGAAGCGCGQEEGGPKRRSVSEQPESRERGQGGLSVYF